MDPNVTPSVFTSYNNKSAKESNYNDPVISLTATQTDGDEKRRMTSSQETADSGDSGLLPEPKPGFDTCPIGNMEKLLEFIVDTVEGAVGVIVNLNVSLYGSNDRKEYLEGLEYEELRVLRLSLVIGLLPLFTIFLFLLNTCTFLFAVSLKKKLAFNVFKKKLGRIFLAGMNNFECAN